MSNTIKFPIFKGLGSEDPDQVWFIANVVWTTQQITDDHIKKAHFVITLQDCVLTWYIKYFSNNPLATLAETKVALKKEFSKPKSNSQSVVDLRKS